MIPRKRDEFALLVPDRNAETVGIGIGAEHDVGADLPRELDAHGERFPIFGIGHFHRGKLGVWNRLFLHDRHVDAEFFQNPHDGYVPRTVYRRIDEF